MKITDIECPLCHDVHDYEVDIQPKQYNEWISGKLIQDAMPNLSPADRELFVTGMCYSCQAEVFGA